MHKRIISGPPTAEILIVGEAPGEQEEKTGLPFVGSSGMELSRMLNEAGIDRNACRIANVCNVRPPKNKIEAFMPSSKKDALAVGAKLYKGEWVTQEIIDGHQALVESIDEMPNLKLILPAGNTPLWAGTSKWGITKWRGSQMYWPHKDRMIPCVPFMHPAAIMRQWEYRWSAILDLKRAMRWKKENFRVPVYQFITRPSYRDTLAFLDGLVSRLDSGERVTIAGDIETRQGHIACICLASSPLDAISIPFMESTGSYWTVEQEIEIIWLLSQILTHKNIHLIGQNWLYDRQYIAKHWGIDAKNHSDTMVKQHVCFPGVSKGLDFISSIYNDYHCYWKDESKDWDPAIGEDQLWVYNCKDGVATWEGDLHLDGFIKAFKLESQLADQMEDCENAFEAMLQGMPVDMEYRARLANNSDLEKDTGLIAMQMKELKEFLYEILGVRIEPSSSKQVHWLCYHVFKLPEIRKPGTKNLTADKDAIADWLRSCEPLYRPLLQAIADYRSLQVFRSTFALAPIDPDGNFRCGIRVAGPSTFRWSTAEDSFGYGGNMQNLPSGDD